jgi:hypothetical protein
VLVWYLNVMQATCTCCIHLERSPTGLVDFLKAMAQPQHSELGPAGAGTRSMCASSGTVRASDHGLHLSSLLCLQHAHAVLYLLPARVTTHNCAENP